MLRYMYMYMFIIILTVEVKDTLHIKHRVLLSTVVFFYVAEDGTMAL